MIKIDWAKIWNEHVWFGWHYVPKLRGHESRWTKRWYFLGWDYAFIPYLRKGTNPPVWYMKIFKIGGHQIWFK